MSMLTRYRRAGGFVQLLQLIETCEPKKQAKLLETVENEDPRWAREISKKMLTLSKVLSWDGPTLGEVCFKLQDLTLAVAFHGLTSAQEEKFLETFSHTQRRRITDLKAEKSPSDAEIKTAFNKLLETVREMISHGELNLKALDPSLIIEDDIEEKLNELPNFENSREFGIAEMAMPSAKTEDLEKGEVKEGLLKAVQRIKSLNAELLKIQKENIKLKQENQQLKQKILKAKTYLAA